MDGSQRRRLIRRGDFRYWHSSTMGRGSPRLVVWLPEARP
jgi:hypothetical protein